MSEKPSLEPMQQYITMTYNFELPPYTISATLLTVPLF